MRGLTGLFVTDSYKNSVHGISVFSFFYVEHYLLKHYESVLVYETATGKVFAEGNKERTETNIEHIYINAWYSRSECLAQNGHLKEILRSQGILIQPTARFYLISHGWPLIKFRCNYYSIYSYLKSFRLQDVSKRLLFFDELILLSTDTDEYRHKDFACALKMNMPYFFYDFSSEFVEHFKNNKANELDVNKDYVLVIANFEHIKNLWWLIVYNIKRKIRRKENKKFVLLTKPKKSILFSLFKRLATYLSIEIQYNQSDKVSLLNNCQYLFIPSYSEYNPIVALEAIALEKNVLSLFKIIALTRQRHYRYLSE